MQTAEQVLESIKVVLTANHCPIDVETVTAQTPLAVLEMDSVSLTLALMDLEEQFDVLVPDEIWAAWQTIENVINYILDYKKQTPHLPGTAGKETSGE